MGKSNKNKTVGENVTQTLKSISRKPSWPSDIQQCINGKIINLSTASEYWRKCAEAALPRIQALVKKRGAHQYEFLNDDLWKYFLNLMQRLLAYYHPKSLKDIHPEMSGGDWVARFLYDAAHLFGKPKVEALEQWPFLLWPKDLLISGAWNNLSDLTVPPGQSSVMLADPGPGSELRVVRPDQFPLSRLLLTQQYSQDRGKLPKVSIEVEGASVCVLMKAQFELKDPKERRRVRAEANRIWSSLIKWMVPNQMKSGRPRGNRGKEAARLHYRDGLTWTKVAEKLCLEKEIHQRSNPSHIRLCKENFRKQAAQFFRGITQHIKTLPPARAEE